MGSVVFSKFWHSVRNPYKVRHGRAEKKFFCGPKMGEMGQKKEFRIGNFESLITNFS